MPPTRDPMGEATPLQRYEVRPGVVLKLSAADVKNYPNAKALKVGQSPSRVQASTDESTPEQNDSAAKPTKKELLARADELGIEGLNQRTSNDDIAAAIAKAEAQA